MTRRYVPFQASGFAFGAFGSLAAIAVLAAWPARADEAADIAAARILGEDGLALADAGSCDKAIEKLDRAERLRHAPTTAGRLGECEIQLGRLVAGTEHLRRITREALAPTAPPIFVDAVARARGLLEQTLPRIPVLRISVKAPAGARFVVTVDGDPVPDAVVDNDRPADPGPHTIRVTAYGFIGAPRTVILNEGETKIVSLQLDPDPHAVLLGPPPLPVGDVGESHASSGQSTAGFVALGIGAVGLAAGIGGGIVVALESADLSSSCGPSRVCPPDKQSEIGSAKTWATVSTTGFIVAGVGLGTGLVLLLTRHRESRGLSSRVELAPVLGPTYVGVTGGF
jgi:hypothetical protein